MQPILNFLGDHLKSLVETYIGHIPDDKKEAFAKHAEDFALKAEAVAVENGTKGLAEGGIEAMKK